MKIKIFAKELAKSYCELRYCSGCRLEGWENRRRTYLLGSSLCARPARLNRRGRSFLSPELKHLAKSSIFQRNHLTASSSGWKIIEDGCKHFQMMQKSVSIRAPLFQPSLNPFFVIDIVQCFCRKQRFFSLWKQSCIERGKFVFILQRRCIANMCKEIEQCFLVFL